jgi:hypothetical protein
VGLGVKWVVGGSRWVSRVGGVGKDHMFGLFRVSRFSSEKNGVACRQPENTTTIHKLHNKEAEM